jgi:hypothetical protein
MSGLQDSCPFEPQARAARCESCCDAARGLTPCVVAWLNPGRPAQLKALAYLTKIGTARIEEHRKAA